MKASNTKSGNPYHDDSTGQFTSPNGGSGNSQLPPWISKLEPNSLPGWISKAGSDDNSSSTPSMWEKVKKEMWWESRELRDVQYIVDNIDKYFEDDMLDAIEKAGFSTTDRYNKFFPSSTKRTSHSYINAVLTNLVAKKMFHPITEVEPKEFDKEWKQNMQSVASSHYGSNYFDVSRFPYQAVANTGRGVHNRDARVADMRGETDNPLILPNGCYGSCTYSAYDQNLYTAKSYAGRSGYVFKMMIDNKAANTITSANYSQIRRDFLQHEPEMEQKLTEYLQKKGKDSNYIQKMCRILRTTTQNDYTFPAVMLGYDCVYETSSQYSLILNYKHVKVKKEW